MGRLASFGYKSPYYYMVTLTRTGSHSDLFG